MNERPALGTAVLYVLAALAVVMSVYPFLYALSTSMTRALNALDNGHGLGR